MPTKRCVQEYIFLAIAIATIQEYKRVHPIRSQWVSGEGETREGGLDHLSQEEKEICYLTHGVVFFCAEHFRLPKEFIIIL